MRLLVWLELRRLRNAVRNLGGSPVRLLLSLAVWGLLAVGVGLQLLLVLTPPTGPRADHLAQLTGASADRLAAVLCGSLLLLTYHLLNLGLEGQSLAFTPADAACLLPGPLPRRLVVAYKLLRDAVLAAVAVAFGLLMFAGQVRLTNPPHWRAALVVAPPTLWLYVVFVSHLGHLLNLALTFHRDRWRGLPTATRLLILAVAATLTVLAGRVTDADWAGGLTETLATPPARLLLFPLVAAWEALLTPFAGPPSGVGWRLMALACLALGSGWLIVCRPENIYEPGLVAGERRAALRRALRTGHLAAATAVREGGAPPFPRPFGRGRGVLLWKSLAQSLRGSARPMVFYLCLTVGLPPLLGLLGDRLGARWSLRAAPLVCVYLAWLSGMTLYRSVQTELRRVDLLKPLPLPGWSVIAALVLPLTIIWSGGLVAGLGLLTLLAPEVSRPLAGAVALVLPWLLLLLGALHAATAVLLPASDDPTQTLAANFGLMLLTGATLVPLGVVAVVLAVLGWPAWQVGLAVAALCATLAILALWLADRLYKRYDPTD